VNVKRLWDRAVAGLCVRCGSDKQLRLKCTQPVLPWESDFDKGPHFWKPARARKHCQLTAVPGGALCATVDTGPARLGIAPVAVNACSSASACLLGAGVRARSCKPVPCSGLGDVVLSERSTLSGFAPRRILPDASLCGSLAWSLAFWRQGGPRAPAATRRAGANCAPN
jgi:hypothetical protein